MHTILSEYIGYLILAEVILLTLIGAVFLILLAVKVKSKNPPKWIDKVLGAIARLLHIPYQRRMPT